MEHSNDPGGIHFGSSKCTEAMMGQIKGKNIRPLPKLGESYEAKYDDDVFGVNERNNSSLCGYEA